MTVVQWTITATIVAIDRNAPSVTFTGEKVNWTCSSRVADKSGLAKVNVGVPHEATIVRGTGCRPPDDTRLC